MTTWLWQTSAGRDPDLPLHRVICSSERRAGESKRDRLPHERLAWPERVLPAGGVDAYRAARDEGARAFVLWRDREKSEALARVVTTSASPRQGAEYEVHDAEGRPLAVVRREPASFGRLRRARWTVSQLDGHDPMPATGPKGRLGSWCLWLPLLPFQFLLTLITLGAFNGVDPPRRTRLRVGEKVVLDYHGIRRDLEVQGEEWDPRSTLALLVLVDSWESGLGFSPSQPSVV